MAIYKGTNRGVLLEIMSSNDIGELQGEARLWEVKKRYNAELGKTSKETIKGYVREDVIVRSQRNRFIAKLPQDLKKLDLMVAHQENGVIKISFVQLKGQNSSFNSSSEPKTLESMAKCFRYETYKEFFFLLPDELNPTIDNKPYEVEMVIGMVYATGSNTKYYDGVEIKYLSGDDFLLYLGLEMDTVDLASEINNDYRVVNHTYDAVHLTDDWFEVYDKCLRKLNYD